MSIAAKLYELFLTVEQYCSSILIIHMAARRAKPDTTIYLLRDIDKDLWRRARSRAILEQKTIREVILQLLEAWAPSKPKQRRSS